MVSMFCRAVSLMMSHSSNAAEAHRCRGLQVLVAFGAGHAIEDATVSLKDAMPQEAVVLKGLLIASLLLHD